MYPRKKGALRRGPYKRSGSLVRPRHSTAMYTVGLVAPSAREAAEARLSERNRSIGMTVRKSGRKNARGRKGRRNKPSPHGDFPNAKSGSPDVILKTIHIRREQRFELHPGSQNGVLNRHG